MNHTSKKIPKKNMQRGFTLLETLVAIFILTLSITGPVYIASVAFHNTIDSRDNISAQYIAEEVIEVIRNNRDRNSLTNSDPSTWFDQVTGTANCTNPMGASLDNKCVMNRDNLGEYVFTACLSGGCPNISFDPLADTVYGKDGVLTTSKFIREFYIETNPGRDGEIKLTVNIRWEDKGRPKIYTLTESMYAVNYKSFFKPGSSN